MNYDNLYQLLTFHLCLIYLRVIVTNIFSYFYTVFPDRGNADLGDNNQVEVALVIYLFG